MWWPFKKKEPMTFETEFGTFERASKRKDEQWLLETGDVDISIDDVGGVPSPDFLERLPTVLNNLDAISKKVRDECEEVTENHELSSISQDSGCDYLLAYCYDEEHWGESVFIKMIDGEPYVDAIVD